MSYNFDFGGLLPYWDQFAEGVWLTIQLSVAATIAGFVLGTLCAIARTSGSAMLKTIVGAYVDVIRNTPLLVQLFIIYFGIATLGLRIPANVAATVALVVNIGAYVCEIMRAGIEAVRRRKSRLPSVSGSRLRKPTGTLSFSRRSNGSTLRLSASSCCSCSHRRSHHRFRPKS